MPYDTRISVTSSLWPSWARTAPRSLCRIARLEPLEQRTLLSATLWTDKLDYLPGDTAGIYASGFQAGATVQFQVLHQDGLTGGAGHDPWLVTDGGAGDLDGVADGNIHTSWYVNPDDSAGETFVATASSLSTGETAQAVFSDTPQSQVQGVTITGVTPGTITSLPQDITVAFTYMINSPGTGTAAATIHVVGVTSGFDVPISTSPSPLDGSAGSHNATLTFSIPTGTPDGSYNIQVKVTYNGDDHDSKLDTMLDAFTVNTGPSPGPVPALPLITGQKFEDADGNLATTTDQSPVEGWTILVTDQNNVTTTLSPTDAGGFYAFAPPAPGTYVITEQANPAWTQLGPTSYTVVVAADGTISTGQANSNAFFNFHNVTISGVKFKDHNGNGIQDAGDQGLEGWHILVNGVDTGVATDANGNYSFMAGPGTYTIQEVQQVGWTQTYGNAGYTVQVGNPAGDPGLTTAVSTNSGSTPAGVYIQSGGTDTANDFGNFKNVTISGMKFYDTNANGVKDLGEPGIAGFRILVNGVYTGVVTGSDGSYSFTVGPGTFAIKELLPSATSDGTWVQTFGKDGVHDPGGQSGQQSCLNHGGLYQQRQHARRRLYPKRRHRCRQ